MTGYLTTAGGDIWRLPPLLEWQLLRTDGKSCDSADVVFCYEPTRLQVLKEAVYLRLEEDGATQYLGVVDEFTASVGENGRRVELHSRGLMALMMDSQLRAAEFSAFAEKDAIDRLVRPFGITKVKQGGLPTVRNFSWDTAATPWQVLCGYCRHAGGGMPRFLADGTLCLEQEKTEKWTLTDGCAYVDAKLRQRRYGVIAKHVVVRAGAVQETAENSVFQRLGGRAQKVSMQTGKTLKASWRTAKQRVEDSMEDALTVTVVLPGILHAEPGDTVELNLERGGFRGSFLLRSIKKTCSKAGRLTTLELEGVLA